MSMLDPGGITQQLSRIPNFYNNPEVEEDAGVIMKSVCSRK